MSHVIRSACTADAAQISALWRRCDLVVSYNDPGEDLRFALAGPASDVLVREAVGVDGASEIIGSVMVGHDGHRGWLYYVAVDPRFQRQGIGRAMVHAGVDWLRQRRVPKVQLMVRDTNQAVICFYERLGFAVAPRTVMSAFITPNGVSN